jgi:hypothetical protein
MRKAFATWLRKIADRLDPPSPVETNEGGPGGVRPK